MYNGKGNIAKREEEFVRLSKMKERKKVQERARAEEKRVAEERAYLAAEKKRKEQERRVRLAEERQRKADERRKARLAEERQQKADERREEQERRARLIKEVSRNIHDKIEAQWIRPRGYYRGLSCDMEIRLKPGGVVKWVNIIRSNGNSHFDDSAKDAAYKASPLPIPNEVFDEFEKELILRFKP
jgi:colicin import membrane protein